MVLKKFVKQDIKYSIRKHVSPVDEQLEQVIL